MALPVRNPHSAANVAYHLNHGDWIVHRGHGTSKYLSYLPESFSSSGQPDLYLFERADLCKCAKSSGASGMDIIFLGGDPTRELQLSMHQLFTEQPYEVHESPTECDSVYSSSDSPCGLLVKNPLTESFCNSSLQVFSINFDKYSKPFSILDIVYSKVNDSYHRNFTTVVIIDPQRIGMINLHEFNRVFSNISASYPLSLRVLPLLHNSHQSAEDEASESSLQQFLSNNISFLNFHAIMSKFSAQYTRQSVHDMNSYKSLFAQMALNVICDIQAEQSMLYGLKVGSFLLKEKKVYTEGMLMRAGNSREIFLMRNGTLHAFPNWDTFVSGGYEGKHIRPIPPVEWADIPVGSPLDPCTKC